MTYEYNLRRLFLPPIESLPIEDQLTRYRQRDLVPSHLHRIGTHLFGGCSFNARRRVVDASHYSPQSGVIHHTLLNTSFDGRTHERYDRTYGRLVKSLSEPSVKLSESESKYRKWIADRKVLRHDLDSLGPTERWLTSKERTPLETSLLTRLRNESKKKDRANTKPEVEISEIPSDTSEETSKSPNPQKVLLKFKRQIIKEISDLEQFLAAKRRRFISLLAAADKAHNRYISVSEMLSVLNKIKAPLSQSVIEILLQVLEITDNGLLDYQQLINGSISVVIEEHFESLESKLLFVEDETDKMEPVTSEDVWITRAADLEKKHGAPGTLTGEHGTKAEHYKQEEVMQFLKLIKYCKENGIILNWQMAEKALLSPPDKPKQECLGELRQAGLSLLSRHFAESPQEQAQIKQRDTYEGFGKAYKELRGKGKATFMRLPTGAARVKAKTDCWLTYDEYLKLTKRIRSKPGFKYKDHGLPDNNAFWPGALLDKLRLWMPQETLLDKPYSLYNVFQPVQQPSIYNPIVEQKMSWPENTSGYVQFGSQDRKQYQL